MRAADLGPAAPGRGAGGGRGRAHAACGRRRCRRRGPRPRRRIATVAGAAAEVARELVARRSPRPSRSPRLEQGVDREHHARACRSRTGRAAWRVNASAMRLVGVRVSRKPSMVVTARGRRSRPRGRCRSSRARRRRSTVHVPHTWTSQERLAPVSPRRSRSTSSSRSWGSTSSGVGAPVEGGSMRTLSEPAASGAAGCARPAAPRRPSSRRGTPPGTSAAGASARGVGRDRSRAGPRALRDRPGSGSARSRASGRQHRPADVLASDDDAVVAQQRRPPAAQRLPRRAPPWRRVGHERRALVERPEPVRRTGPRRGSGTRSAPSVAPSAVP